MSTEQPKVGLPVLTAAVILGLAADGLLRAGPPGLNVLLWLAALTAAGAVLLRRAGLRPARDGWWLAAALLSLAALLAWRNAPPLQAVTVLALLLTLALAARYGRPGGLTRAGADDYVLSTLLAGLQVLSGPVQLALADTQWPALNRSRWSQPALAVLRGAAIGLPLLLVFGLLFVSADAAFQRLVTGLFRVDLETLFDHLVPIAFWTWMAAAFLHGLVLSKDTTALRVPRPPQLTLGLVEMTVALGLLVALFLAFVLVQLGYFFGGAALVLSSADLTYAEYARRGFFELVAVAALLLPVLWVVHWLLPADRTDLIRRYRYLASALLVLLGVIMASALHRMFLYQQAYGLTELRLYATALMLWLAAVCGWFAATVLRGRSERFATGALAAALAGLILLHALNPQALIVRTNAARLAVEGRLDAVYLSALSADAVPALVRILPDLAPAHQQYLAERILRRWGDPATAGDWRSWNWGRWVAVRTVAAHRPMLETLAE